VHDLQFVLEELEPTDHALHDAAEHRLGHARDLELVHRAGVHELHAVVHAALDEKGAVELDDLGRNGAVEDVKLHDDPVQLGVVELEPDLLHRHRHVRRLVEHALDGAVVALAEVLGELELGHVDREGLAVRKVDAGRGQDGLSAEAERAGGVAGDAALDKQRAPRSHPPTGGGTEGG
jgi:hypothetical protein